MLLPTCIALSLPLTCVCKCLFVSELFLNFAPIIHFDRNYEQGYAYR